MIEQIAKINSTALGYEDHGIFTAWLDLHYGTGDQGAGGYALDSYDETKKQRVGHKCGMDFIIGILHACGVEKWEDVKGKTVIALREDGFHGKVIGLKPLPTEKGSEFLFESAFS